MHFTYNDIIYHQNDEIAMGSPLVSTLSVIFIIQLENIITPKLSDDVTFYRSFVDDTVAFVKHGSINLYLITLITNRFHEKIQLTFEIENNNSLSFVDTLLIKRQLLPARKRIEIR